MALLVRELTESSFGMCKREEARAQVLKQQRWELNTNGLIVRRKHELVETVYRSFICKKDMNRQGVN